MTAALALPPRLRIDRYIAPPNVIRSFRLKLHEPIAVHWHEFYEMHLITSGAACHVLNGEERCLTAGSFFLMTPADFHEIRPEPGADLELYNVIFSDNALDDEVRRLALLRTRDWVVQLDGDSYTSAAAEFRRLWSEEQSLRPGYRRVMQGGLERILVDVSRLESEDERAASTSCSDSAHRMRSAVAYLHHHFREPLTLAGVAGSTNLSPNYFSELFHRTTGQPFQRYLQDLRLRFARSLLSASELPITEIAYACGFSSLSHFERSFRLSTGVSPRTYRSSRPTVTVQGAVVLSD